MAAIEYSLSSKKDKTTGNRRFWSDFSMEGSIRGEKRTYTDILTIGIKTGNGS